MIELALKVARRSQSKFRLGAVLTVRKDILGEGWNQMGRTHPRQLSTYRSTRRDWVPGLHAEVHACLGFDAVPRGASVWVARIHRNGQPALAAPCDLCITFLAHIGVERVWFTTGNEAKVGMVELA